MSRSGKPSLLFIVFLFGLSAFALRAQPLPAPENYWKFEDGSGNTALDTMGALNGNIFVEHPGPGTAGAANWVAGKSGGAFHFDGVNDRIMLNGGDLSASWTASVWVRREGAGNRGAMLMQGGGMRQLFLHTFDGSFKNPTPRASITGAVDQFFNYSSPLTWDHLVFVGEPAKVSLYVNGVFNSSVQSGGVFPRMIMGSGRFMLFPPGYQAPLQGTLDEFIIFKQALTAAEVAKLYGQNGVLYPDIQVLAPALIPAGGSKYMGQFSAGTTGAMPVTIKNNGSIPLKITGISNSNNTDFRLKNPPAAGTSLNRLASLNFELDFVGYNFGTRSTVVTVTTNDPDTPVYRFTVYARHATHPQLKVTYRVGQVYNSYWPTAYNGQRFTLNQKWSAPNSVIRFRLTNGGDEKLNISRVTISDSRNFTLSFVGGRGNPGYGPRAHRPDTPWNILKNGDKTLIITYNPGQRPPGPHTARVTIYSNDGGTQKAFTVTIVGSVYNPYPNRYRRRW